MQANAASGRSPWLLLVAILVPACGKDNEAPLPLAPALAAFSVHVTYCRQQEPVLPIEGVHVQLVSDADTLDATTDMYGIVDFDSIPQGLYSLVLTRPAGFGDLDSVTLADFIELYKAIEGVVTLSDCQAQAADVTQDGIIDQQDMESIVRWMSFYTSGTFYTAEWRFKTDPPVIYVSRDTTLEASGIFLGDVNLTWPNPNP